MPKRNFISDKKSYQKNKKARKKNISDEVMNCYEYLGDVFFILYEYLNENQKKSIRIIFIRNKKLRIVAGRMIKNPSDVFDLFDIFRYETLFEIFRLCIFMGIIKKKDVKKYINHFRAFILLKNKEKIFNFYYCQNYTNMKKNIKFLNKFYVNMTKNTNFNNNQYHKNDILIKLFS